jgi:predicted transcriptional regulator
MIDLVTARSYVFQYLLANNMSECCVGISRQEFPVYDILVLKEDDMSLPEAYRQIKIYLNNLR